MTINTALRCSLGLALGISVFGQGRAPSPSIPTPAPPSTTTTRLPTNNPANTNTTTNIPDMRPVYVAGKVVMEDGTSPGESVAIQLACRGNPRTLGQTDHKGTFSIDLNNKLNSAVFGDASEAGGYRGIGSNNSGNLASGSGQGSDSIERSLMGCDIQASLAGFRSDSVHLARHGSLDNPDIGIIILHRIANVEGLTISATTRMAPKDAQKAFDKGLSEARKAKWENAERELQKSVDIYPKFATAWWNLGRVQEEQNNIEGARKSYASALAADGKFVSPYLQLALIAVREQKWQDVADQTDHLLKLNPIDFPQAWLYNSMANYYLKKMDVAEESARSGLSHDLNHRYAKLSQVLAVVLAEKRDYAGATANLRDYLKYAPNATDAEMVRKQLAEVEKQVGMESGKTAVSNQ